MSLNIKNGQSQQNTIRRVDGPSETFTSNIGFQQNIREPSINKSGLTFNFESRPTGTNSNNLICTNNSQYQNKSYVSNNGTVDTQYSQKHGLNVTSKSISRKNDSKLITQNIDERPKGRKLPGSTGKCFPEPTEEDLEWDRREQERIARQQEEQPMGRKLPGATTGCFPEPTEEDLQWDREYERLQALNNKNEKFDAQIETKFINQKLPINVGQNSSQIINRGNNQYIVTQYQGKTFGDDEDNKDPTERIEWKVGDRRQFNEQKSSQQNQVQGERTVGNSYSYVNSQIGNQNISRQSNEQKYSQQNQVFEERKIGVANPYTFINGEREEAQKQNQIKNDGKKFSNSVRREQTEFYTSNTYNSSIARSDRRIPVSQSFQYDFQKNQGDRRTVHVRSNNNSMFSQLRQRLVEDLDIKRKEDVVRDNSQIEQTYQNGVQLREQQGDFRVYRVNEQYLSSQPLRYDKVEFSKSVVEQLPKKIYDRQTKKLFREQFIY